MVLDIVRKILLIPGEFNKVKTKSWNTLVTDSGYLENYDKIHETIIVDILRTKPGLVSDWLQWSEDQRASPAWYFRKFNNGECEVGYLPADKEYVPLLTFDEIVACAYYIKQ